MVVVVELYGRGQPSQYIERLSKGLASLVATRRRGHGGVRRSEVVDGRRGGWETTDRGLMAHALLAPQAEGGYDGERADRAGGRPSMEITSDQ